MACLLVLLLNDSFQDKKKPDVKVTETVSAELKPDYYAENLQLRVFNEQGGLQSSIKSNLLSHYVEYQQANIESPEITLYSVDGDIWIMNSTSGTIQDNTRNLSLLNDVTIKVSDSDEQQKMLLQTEELYFDVLEQSFWTDSPISAVSNSSSFAAIGLHMALKTEQLQLKEKVKIHYDF
ncbi:MAG: LPS export ABC transporter periplasmic protein LptC [Gammaproteobacteria bacterium]|nr:LPS export ABC transporter periplasmic protein LptC [Gammaproteobacteria bacterium]